VAAGEIGSLCFEELFRTNDGPDELRRQLNASQAMNRMGAPEEIADAFLFLACDESSFCTGPMLTVDGGMMAL